MSFAIGQRLTLNRICCCRNNLIILVDRNVLQCLFQNSLMVAASDWKYDTTKNRDFDFGPLRLLNDEASQVFKATDKIVRTVDGVGVVQVNEQLTRFCNPVMQFGDVGMRE